MHAQSGLLTRIVRVRRCVAVLAVGVVASVGFAKLADSAREHDSVTRFDDLASRWVQGHRVTTVSFLRGVTDLCDPRTVAVIWVLAAVSIVSGRGRRSAVLLLASSGGTALLVTIAKLVVGRQRPPVSGALVTATGYAFPSGHAAQSIACYGCLAALICLHSARPFVRLTALGGAVTLVGLIGLSRVSLGVHWPSDILAGWIVATTWLAVLLVRCDHGLRRRRSAPLFGSGTASDAVPDNDP